MLNLNINTLYSKLNEQPRGVFTPLISASFVLIGGGGGGSNTTGGGGAGAGCVVSGSFNMVVGYTYTVIVGSANSASIYGGTEIKAEDSWIFGYNNNEFTSSTVKAGGGYNGGRAAGPQAFRNGGNSGNGFYYIAPNQSQSFSSFTGGNYNSQGTAPQPTYYAAGGGAGSSQNGEDGFSGGGAGDGGNGFPIISSSFQTYGYYSSSCVTPPICDPIGKQATSLGAAGGGCGGSDVAASAGNGGFYGGGNEGYNAYGPGSGGAGSGIGFQATNGGDGTAVIVYCGRPKMNITNGTTTYDSANDRTIHTFNKGTGSFVYDAEYITIPGCGY